MVDNIRARLEALFRKIEARGVPKCRKCGQEQMREGTCAGCRPTAPVGHPGAPGRASSDKKAPEERKYWDD